MEKRFALMLAALTASVAFAGPKDWNITALGSLPSERPFSIAEAVNNRGDIVGWSYIFDPAINSNRGYAVLWQNGTIQNLGEGSASAINERGTIAGSTDIGDGLSVYKDGRWQSLGSPGAPFGINKFEAIAGWHMGPLSHAYLYRDGLFTDLGTLGGTDSMATGINDRGQVAGFAKVPGDSNYHAFLYERGVMKDLGTILGGSESRAHDINNHGVVVGEAWDAFGNSQPFVYDGTMRQLFTGHGCVVPRAINDHGWIVGMGRKGPLVSPAIQVWEAFVLKPR